MDNVIEIRNVTIDYKLKRYDIRAITDVSLDIKRGKITALVGESGSGKTTLSSAILQCISTPGEVVAGSIKFFGRDGAETDVCACNNHQINKFRWEKVSMVFQAAQSALNPVMTVFEQFEETVREHRMGWDKARIEQRTREVLEDVKLDADRVMKAYPHELSGGMKQRVMIAFALIFEPELIILDEPTTALDVITQDYIFKILQRINREKGISMLLMTHDIGVVAKFADYVGVMYAGRLMEYGDIRTVFKQRRHPYTAGLIGSTPSLIGSLDDMRPIEGNPPDLRDLPEGCVFSPRCPYCTDKCKEKEPDDFVKDGCLLKCVRYGE